MNQKVFVNIIITIGVIILVIMAGYFINQQKPFLQQNQEACIPEDGLNYENVYSATPIDQRLKCCPGLVSQENPGVADVPAVCVKPTPTQMSETNSGVGAEYKDVKYFFDNIDSFNENLSRSGISESVFIRGKLVEAEVKVQCIKVPCLPVKHFALQDINNQNYNIVIYQVNSLTQKLEIGRSYILGGILKKGVDFGKKIVFINNFEPEEIIKVIQ